MSSVQDKVYNIELVVEDIKKFPQTYETILKDEVENGTLQFILRRKLNILCKDGEVCKLVVPGTRKGKVLYYCHPKDYYILIDNTRLGSAIFCFFEYKKLDKIHIKVEKLWKLKGENWDEVPTQIFSEGTILKLF